MPTEIKIQVSFQGGGAKIVDLLAAADAIQSAAAAGNISISRLAGTSAGSIVATLLAFDVEISKIDSSQFQKVIESIHAAPGFESLADDDWISKGLMLKDVVQGNPFIADGSLATIIRTFLEAVGIDPDLPIRDAPKPIFITASSQVDKKGIFFHRDSEEYNDMTITEELRVSCNIPLIFTNYRPDIDMRNAFIDGGLCENLPVEPLTNEKDEFAPVLAIGVTSDTGTWPARNALQYLGLLFDIAMNNSGKRSEGFVGSEGLYKVVSKRNSTDFLSVASTFKLGYDYLRVYDSCLKWLTRRAASMQPIGSQSLEVTSDPTIWDVLGQNERSFQQRVKDYTYQIEYAALIATANSWSRKISIEEGDLPGLDNLSRVHLVPRQSDFELSEYPIGTSTLREALPIPSVLKVEVIQKDGERRPAKHEMFRVADKDFMFGEDRTVVKSVISLDEPLAKLNADLAEDDAEKLLIWYQQPTESVFPKLADPSEREENFGLFSTPAVQPRLLGSLLGGFSRLSQARVVAFLAPRVDGSDCIGGAMR